MKHNRTSKESDQSAQPAEIIHRGRVLKVRADGSGKIWSFTKRRMFRFEAGCAAAPVVEGKGIVFGPAQKTIVPQHNSIVVFKASSAEDGETGSVIAWATAADWGAAQEALRFQDLPPTDRCLASTELLGSLEELPELAVAG